MKKETNTTIAISPKENERLTGFCRRNQMTKKGFIKQSLDYFEKNGINPKGHNAPKSELEIITKRINQLFAFIKTQEKEYLRPSVQAIIATETRFKESLENISTKEYDKRIAIYLQENIIKDLKSVIGTNQKDIVNIENKNTQKLEILLETIIQELDEIKNKKRGLF